MTEKSINFLGIDITEAVIEDNGSIDAPLTSSDMLSAAFRPDNLTVKNLKVLKKELLASPEKYKDVLFCAQESTGDKIKDMLSQIDLYIYQKENGLYDSNALY